MPNKGFKLATNLNKFCWVDTFQRFAAIHSLTQQGTLCVSASTETSEQLKTIQAVTGDDRAFCPFAKATTYGGIAQCRARGVDMEQDALTDAFFNEIEKLDTRIDPQSAKPGLP